MKALKMCLNWKVIVGLALLGVGVFVYAPGSVAAVLPILILAICPISMIFMVWAMNSGMGGDSKAGKTCERVEQKRPEGQEAELNRLKLDQQEITF